MVLEKKKQEWKKLHQSGCCCSNPRTNEKGPTEGLTKGLKEGSRFKRYLGAKINWPSSYILTTLSQKISSVSTKVIGSHFLT